MKNHKNWRLQKYTQISTEEIIRLYTKENKSTCEIAKIFDISPVTVQKRLRKADIKCRPHEKDITNKEFGKLTALYKIDNKYWFCKCECGTEKSTLKSGLLQGQIKSCGCTNGKGKNNSLWTGHEQIPGNYICRLRIKAKKRKIEFNITAEDIWNQWIKQKGICSISGVSIIIPEKNMKDRTNVGSLDRIDSSKDYTIDNIQWIHKDLQSMKMDKSDEDFIRWVKIIAKYQEEKENPIEISHQNERGTWE